MYENNPAGAIILVVVMVTLVIMGPIYIAFVPYNIGWITFSKLIIGCIVLLLGISFYRNMI